jgi:large subunit ribosomal protein L35
MAEKGMPPPLFHNFRCRSGPITAPSSKKGQKMPKMKTKSGAKKRFSLTATGKVRMNVAGKRHGMSKRPNRMLRQAKGTTICFKADGDNIKKYFLPNG